MKNIKTYEEYKAPKITFKEYLDTYYSHLGIHTINTLFCDSVGLTDLDEIEILINLERLYCTCNNITSLKPILNLTKLETLYCSDNPIDWVDYIDKKGNTWYIILPKSIEILDSDKFTGIDNYWKFIYKNQPAGVSRKFNF